MSERTPGVTTESELRELLAEALRVIEHFASGRTCILSAEWLERARKAVK